MKTRTIARLWGKPWDYAYLLRIERRKFQEMAHYFQKSKLTEGWERQVQTCNLCISLLTIVLEEDWPFKVWLKNNYEDRSDSSVVVPFTKHINTNNSHRFIGKNWSINQSSLCNDSLRIELRRIKAWHLYNLIRTYRMFDLWD